LAAGQPFFYADFQSQIKRENFGVKPSFLLLENPIVIGEEAFFILFSFNCIWAKDVQKFLAFLAMYR